MTGRKRREAGLSREEEQFIERLRERYLPDPMTSGRRAAFDESLRARRGRRERRPIWVPLAAAATGLALTVWLVTGIRVGEDVPQGKVEEEWTYTLIFSTGLEGTRIGDEGETLPEDYLAIESLLLGS